MLGMFGNQGKPNPFAIPETPAFSPTGAPQAPAMGSVGLGMNAPAPVQQPHGFNAPGGWADKLGGLGALLLSAGGNPAGTQMMQDRTQQRMLAWQSQKIREQQDAEQARQQANWLFEVAHPKPINNDTTNDYQFMVTTLGKPAADQWLARKGDPIVNTTLPGNRFYSGPASGLPAALGGVAQSPPSKPIGKLTPIPGGAGSPAPRTFP